MKTRASIIAVITALAAQSAAAQETSYTLYGTPGNIEMPSARSAPDAEISASLSFWRLQQKANFSFQLTDRLSGTFRYSGISERTGPGTDGTFDRSFDLHFRFLDETDTRPALAIGLTDFMGTGILSSEYIVATKAVTLSTNSSPVLRPSLARSTIVTATSLASRSSTRQTSMRAKPNSGASTKPPPLTLVSPIAIAPV